MRRPLRRLPAVAALVALAATGLVVGAPPAGATTFTVTTNAATGPGSFREAMQDASADANGPHVIQFDPGLLITPTQSALYNGGQPLTIEGNGSTLNVAGDSLQVIQVNTGADVVIRDLTITGSTATSGGAVTSTGAGDLTLEDVTITDNTATLGPGALRSSIAGATVTVRRSVFSGNTTASAGGVMNVSGPVVVEDSVFDGNSATDAGGAILSSSSVTVDRSLFVDNQSASRGGAISALLGTSAVTVRNSTFVDNRLTGVFTTGSALDAAGDLIIDHSWFENNTGTTAGTNQIVFGNPAAGHQLTSSVLVEPGATGENCGGNILRDTGYTISSDDSCFPAGVGGPEEGDVEDFVGDLRMGPLRDNGGLVPTKFPLAGSPVLDGGPAVGPTSNCSLADDARSVARPFPSSATHCDLGPVEATYPPSTLSDVPNWAADAIAWITSSVNDPRLMEGFADTNTFEPSDPITRAQVVRMLYRLMGEPDVSGLTHPFTDVPNWVEPAVLWAYNEGAPDFRIVTGVTATKFKPNDPITRGQVVRMLYRTAGAPETAGMPPHPFTDVPNWVEEAVTWAANTDNPLPLFTGITATKFKPSDDITRAQVARSTYRMAITPEVWNSFVGGTVPFVAP